MHAPITLLNTYLEGIFSYPYMRIRTPRTSFCSQRNWERAFDFFQFKLKIKVLNALCHARFFRDLAYLRDPPFSSFNNMYALRSNCLPSLGLASYNLPKYHMQLEYILYVWNNFNIIYVVSKTSVSSVKHVYMIHNIIKKFSIH